MPSAHAARHATIAIVATDAPVAVGVIAIAEIVIHGNVSKSMPATAAAAAIVSVVPVGAVVKTIARVTSRAAGMRPDATTDVAMRVAVTSTEGATIPVVGASVIDRRRLLPLRHRRP